ncbi:50S ribosomal protein L16 [Candidatus Bathyarchaeota archaeon]|nr:50S ribosomal protein L16 [Candidatus Bathyarchaeota archaeon]
MKARNYREVKGMPYTRHEYVHGPPQPKITKFTAGKPSESQTHQVSLVADKRIQIRHNALEAARIAANRYLQEKLGDRFFMRVMVLPHMILRENKMIFGAHADRLQEGMRRAFGKPIGRAARVEPNQPIIIVNVEENGLEAAKEALRRAEAKLPTTCRIIIEKLPEQEVQVTQNVT